MHLSSKQALCAVGSLIVLAACTSATPVDTGVSASSASAGSAAASLQAASSSESPVALSSAPAVVTADPATYTAQMQEKIVPVEKAPNYDRMTGFLHVTLTSAQKAYLNEHKFLLLPQDAVGRGLTSTGFDAFDAYNFDQMLTDFDKIGGPYSAAYRRPENAKLITPDAVLHAYHRLFENSLEKLEAHELKDLLTQFVTGVSESALRIMPQTEVQAHAQQVAAQMLIPKILLMNAQGAKPPYFQTPEAETAWTEGDKTIDSLGNALKLLQTEAKALPADLQQKMKDELTFIYAAKDVSQSPLYVQYKSDLKTDYTQFTPRSHYTKSSALRAYFRAMMYLGRNSYFVKSDKGIADANLLVYLLSTPDDNGKKPADTWQRIMDVTSFYAGQSDDITLPEWKAFAAQSGQDAALATPQAAVSASAVSAMRAKLSLLRGPKILADVIVNPDIAGKTKQELLDDTKAFRLFGQRFTFDAWVLNRLTAGEEQTPVRLPSTPSALFVNAVLGNNGARPFIQRFLTESTKNDKQPFTDADTTAFLGKLDEVKADVQKVKPAEWLASMGSAWLDLLSTLTGTYGNGYPLYMQGAAFAQKQMQTFLGSYTELKHDTLLYAKQSYAELGGGAPDEVPPVPKGFVEPNQKFWIKLETLVNRTLDLYAGIGVSADSEVTQRLQRFREDVRFFAAIGEKELKNTPVTDDEYEKLRTVTLGYMAQPLEENLTPDEDTGKVALIADIHTDALKGQILYEATARPYFMLALVGNESSPRLALGVAYNHYELTAPLGGKRLTDEDWRNTVYKNPKTLPAKNFWYDALQVK